MRFRGVFSSFFGLIIATQISTLYADNAVPVLLWGQSVSQNSEPSAVNPFLKTSRAEFDEILTKKIGKELPPFLLFVKDNLCVEDFTQQKEHLQEATSGDFKYLPVVDIPLSAFTDLSTYNQTYNDDVDFVSDGQLVIKSINSLDVIPETYKSIKDSSPNLIAALVGKSCSYRHSERIKRDTAPSDNGTTFLIRTDRVLLYSSQPLYLKLSADQDFIPLPIKPLYVTDRGAGTKESPLILRMQFSGSEASAPKIVLEFKFEVASVGYYSLKSVNYKENDMNDMYLLTNSDIVFPFNFSYHCSQKTIFQKSPVYLNITNLQVQIDATSFSDAYDCVGFTSIPIWTGIFVTAILALIMIWALTMILDIRTMDRFDDPKGKTITISASD